jgi:NodT family efflux transporter outer membrane factor (OMF) lipoprotein
VSLLAELANDYFTLRAVQIRIAVGRAELKRQQDLFVLIQARRKTGFVTDLDVEQQATQVQTAAAQIPQLQAQATAEVHAIAILLAEAPETVEQGLAANASPLAPPPAGLPVGLPSDLLRRRPDIREAERQLASANAQIGVQEARRYPQINLIGLGAFAGPAVDTLFAQQNLASVALGMATQPVFDGGRSHGEIGAAREERLQADLAYRKAVLGAFRDVEDALARYRSEDDRRGNLARSVTSAQNSLNIAEAQYRTGFVTYINVLQADDSLLNAQDQLTQSDAQLLSDLIALYKALGGGWTVAPQGNR